MMLLASTLPDFGMIPVLVLTGYLLLLLGLGWWGYRCSQGGEEDYFLAGRNQGWLVSTLTIMATFLSSFALMGAPGMVYKEGVVFALVSLNAPVAGFCIYLFGNRIRKIGKQRGHVTQADMIVEHYNSPVALRLLTALVGLLFTVPYVMMQIKAGGDLSAVLFREHEHAFEIGAVVLAAITALYVMIGGMRSVAWTDAIQCVLLLGGMLLAGIATIVSFGGFAEFSNAITHLPESSLTIPGTTQTWRWPFLFSVCLLMPIGGILQPAQWMRFYAARDSETLRRGSLIFVIVLAGAFLFGIMPVGLSGQAMYPLATGPEGKVAPAPEVGDFDQILVVILSSELPKLLGTDLGVLMTSLFVVAIMAASMSTADSNLHALSAVVTRDCYDRFLRTGAGESERTWVGRFVIFATTGGALCFVLLGHQPASSLAGFMQMIVGLALFAVAFSVQLLPITIDMLYLKRGGRRGAIAGLAAGIIVAFLFTSLFPMLVSGVALPGLSGLLDLVNACKKVLPIHASAWGLAANVLMFVSVSFWEKPTK